MQNPGQRQRAPAPHSGEGPAAGQPIHLVRVTTPALVYKGVSLEIPSRQISVGGVEKGTPSEGSAGAFAPFCPRSPETFQEDWGMGGMEHAAGGGSQAPTAPHQGTECPDPRRCDQGRQLSPSASASWPGPRVTREHLRPGPVDSPPGEATPKSFGNLRFWRLPQSGDSQAAEPGSDGGGGRRAGRSTGCGRVSTGWGGQPRPLDSGSCGCAPGLTAQPLL